MSQTITGTPRQLVTASDGTKLQRQYVYLPESIWHLLRVQARAANTSVSLLIQTFASSGTANSKGINDLTLHRTK
ncbi:hypothetical protein ACXX82_11865 [Glaciimonas sp. GNP009]